MISSGAGWVVVSSSGTSLDFFIFGGGGGGGSRGFLGSPGSRGPIRIRLKA